MKSLFNFLAVSVSKINRQQIQLLLVVVSLAMLVLGVGAPDDGSSVGR
ncbi:MAG: hypothetical protein HND47_03825 [Chloroflexi bacterium]|nr:hypothetical protein [Chloroflexota bacterium]